VAITIIVFAVPNRFSGASAHCSHQMTDCYQRHWASCRPIVVALVAIGHEVAVAVGRLGRPSPLRTSSRLVRATAASIVIPTSPALLPPILHVLPVLARRLVRPPLPPLAAVTLLESLFLALLFLSGASSPTRLCELRTPPAPPCPFDSVPQPMPRPCHRDLRHTYQPNEPGRPVILWQL